MSTWSPSAAKSRAVAAPMPEAAPVTITTLPMPIEASARRVVELHDAEATTGQSANPHRALRLRHRGGRIRGVRLGCPAQQGSRQQGVGARGGTPRLQV